MILKISFCAWKKKSTKYSRKLEGIRIIGFPNYFSKV